MGSTILFSPVFIRPEQVARFWLCSKHERNIEGFRNNSVAPRLSVTKQDCNNASDSVTRVAVPPDSLYSTGNPRKTLKCKNFIPSGNVPPMNVLEKNDIKTVMHFAKVCDGAEYSHVNTQIPL